MDSTHLDIQGVRKHLENIERELTMLKKLVGTSTETQEDKDETRIRELRKQLLDEGFDEELVQLVGTVPLLHDDYKEEIRAVIYERYQRKYGKSARGC
jgi:hypothetical protein